MLKQYFKRIGAKRMVIMLLGNVFLGMGVSIFKLSEMGTDPFSGMVMALAEVLGIGVSGVPDSGESRFAFRGS